MNRTDGLPVEERALRVFAEFLARRSRVDDAALDALCEAHADLEPNLRALAQARSAVELPAPRVDAGSIAYLRGRLARKGDVAVRTRSRYVLLGEVARGGMGVVLRVWDTVLERPLAMKILDPKQLPKGPESDDAVKRFLTEAQVAGRLEHRGIVPIHDLGVERGGRVYFTMPVLEGRTLEEAFDLARTRSEGWSLERALLALAQVCDVLAYAHARGVVHRDLKPTNVLVDAAGEVCVVDWGLAMLVETAPKEPAEDAEESRRNGAVAGTPPYMAPEQAEGRLDQISCRSDVYALGAILYHLLAGRVPYAPRRGKEEPETTVELIKRGAPTPLRRLAPGAADALVAISEKAMERRPEDRFASAEELARELRAFVESQPADVGEAKSEHA